MDLNFVLPIILYYSLFLYPFESVSAAPKAFEIVEIRKKVEELAVQRAQFELSLKSKIIKPITRLRKNICDKTGPEKVEFCHKCLPMDELGFEFDSWHENDLKCTLRTFWISHPHNEETDTYELEMYPCPNIKYKNLETDTDEFISHKYYVSRGIKYDSAIVYFQIDENDKIYPKKYVHYIIFEKLLSSQSDQKPSMKKERRMKAYPERDIVQYLQAQSIREPYRKFQKTFHSMVICSWPKSHKIYACRESLKDLFPWEIEPFELEGYEQLGCKKYQLQNTFNDNYFTELQIALEDQPQEIQLHLFRCPHERQQSQQKIIINDLYLFSALNPFSVILASRYNNWDAEFVWERIFLMDTSKMVKESRRVRKTMYPLENDRAQQLIEMQRDELNEFVQKLKRPVITVQTPVTLAKIGAVREEAHPDKFLQLPIISRSNRLVEDILLSYSGIKAMIFVYRRFMETYLSIDMCELPHRVKKALCQNILKRKPIFGYYPSSDEEIPSNESVNSIDIELTGSYETYPPDDSINRPCSRRVVNLETHEVGSLKAKHYSLWQCSKAENTGSDTAIYFIAKCHLKNSLLLFKTCDAIHNDNIIFPDAVVAEIDRLDLARIVLHDMTV